MFNPFKKSQSNTAVIEQIHNEFNSAGEQLLKEAKDIIGGCNVEKAERLKKMGFHQTEEVKALEVVNMTKQLAELVSYYQFHYPNYKFITDEQVGKINDKYGLVCAPVSRYKGFVPENKLSLIESFRFVKNDQRETMHRITKWMFTSSDQVGKQEKLSGRYKNLEIPKSMFNGHDAIMVDNSYCFVSEYQSIDYSEKFICAPPKELDLTGLTKNKSLFQKITTVQVPDPVVLQPVNGGYLILAAWGDEASDEIVVNQTLN